MCVCVCISVFKLGGARKGQSAAAPSGVPIVGHLVGNGGGVGVVEHARIVARAGDADAQRIWNGGGINVGAVGAGEYSSGATHCRARARSRCTAAPIRFACSEKRLCAHACGGVRVTMNVVTSSTTRQKSRPAYNLLHFAKDSTNPTGPCTKTAPPA